MSDIPRRSMSRRLLSPLALAAVVFTAACTAQPAPASPTAVPAAVAVQVTATAAPARPASTPAAVATAAATSAPAVAAPVCQGAPQLTPATTEGPFYKAGAPRRISLIEPGMSGAQIALTGYVLDTQCKPIAGAVVDFWQADDKGNYDNTGYRLRGSQVTDANGRYTLQTVAPGLYPGRTVHIHVKVQAPNGPILTTQLYFPGVAQNDRDSIFDKRLLVTVDPASNGARSNYDFVVATR